ncbi:cell wall metabolism sensor histidine kinase WalK [Fodinisporobacter ferrooxydans]|uniref:histidine kinase n=1 Tax=Fodinisporobacter ferrooxydans TaxID=2901836 RepID=A0ABY4CH75_9BACL|nr:cell wall metabolism sensor histidine kinase WalK [Alicyclobacillaceae bacterium MYW30-H2]
MIRNSIVAKLWLTIIGLVIVVLVILSFYLQQLFDSYIFNSQKTLIEDRGVEIATVLSEVPQSNLGVSLAHQLAYQSHSTVSYITGRLGKDVKTKEILSALTATERQDVLTGRPVARRTPASILDTTGQLSKEQQTDSWWVYAPIMKQHSLQGFLVLNQSVDVTEGPRKYISDLILFAVGLGVVLTTGLAFVVSKNLSRPLLKMNEVAERMAVGDFQGEVNVTTRDEVGRLGMTFNYLANRLKSTIEDVSKEKEQLSGIITSMEDAVISADLNGWITLANPSAKKWLRTFFLSEQGKLDNNQLPKELFELEQRVLVSHEVQEYEMTWQGRTIIVTMTPLYEHTAKTLRGAVAVLRDVTEERTLDRLRKDFVANVSHELRTPLAMLQGYSEALLDGFDDDPEQRRELTSIILDETLRMRRLVNDLLDLAQLQSGQFFADDDPVDVDQLVKRVARKYSALAAERNIQLVTEVAESETYIVKGSEDRLEQVVINLVDNAIRHTQEDGSVRLRLHRTGDFCKMQIADTGTGIPAADLPFIWERFYKVDKARTRSKGGTGLGLSIVKNIVESHHGEVLVESEEGIGTVFTVILPIA